MALRIAEGFGTVGIASTGGPLATARVLETEGFVSPASCVGEEEQPARQASKSFGKGHEVLIKFNTATFPSGFIHLPKNMSPALGLNPTFRTKRRKVELRQAHLVAVEFGPAIIESMQTQRKLDVEKYPMCGAPVHVQPHDTVALCAYCDAPITIQHGPQGEFQLSENRALGREAAVHIKTLMAAGQQAQASALYAQRTGATSAEADQAIVKLSEHSHLGMFFTSTFNAIGMTLTLVIVLGLAGLGAWLFTINPMAGIAIIVPWLLMLLFFYRPFIRTIHYLLRARIGQAKILYSALLLEKMEDLHIVRLDLEVHGPDGEVFEVETHIKVAETSLSKIQPGQVLQVKYLPNRPESLLYGRGLKSCIIR